MTHQASGLLQLCEIPPAPPDDPLRSIRDGLMPALQNAYLCLQTWEPRTWAHR